MGVPAPVLSATQPSPAAIPDAFKVDWIPPKPLLTSPDIKLNIPITVSSPDLSLRLPENPSASDLSAAKATRFPLLYETSKKLDNIEAKAMKKLLTDLSALGGVLNPASSGRIKAFLDEHPESGFKTSLLIEQADSLFRHGYFLKTLDVLQDAWNHGKSAKETNDIRIAEVSLARLLRLRSQLGQKDELRALIKDADKYPRGGEANQALLQAKETLWFLDNKAEQNVFCGFTAANEICVPQGQRPIFPDVHDPEEMARFIAQGLSLYELKRHSEEAGGNLKVVKRSPQAPVVFPSVIHWKFDHYSSVTEAANGQYRVKDFHLKFDSWIDPAVIDEQATGYFLVTADTPLPPGYSAVSDDVAKTVFGRHCVHGRDDEGDQGDIGGDDDDCPMTTYSFSSVNPGLLLHDTPIVHRPPFGPEIRFKLNYMQRSAVISSVSNVANLGPRWTFSFSDFIDLKGSGTPNSQVNAVSDDGTYFQYNFNTSAQGYGTKFGNRPRLEWLPPASGGPDSS